MFGNTTFKSLISLATLLLLGLSVFSKDKSPAKTTEKPKIAVLALEAKNIPPVYADIVRDILEVNLHKQGNFAVLERSQINLIMKEQEGTLSGCFETQCAVDYGKILSADLVVVGSISRLTEYNIAVKLVDIRQGRIIAAEFEKAATDQELDKAVNSLATRITSAAGRDRAITTRNENRNGHPLYVGIAFRYGFWSIPLPALKLPDTYGTPLELGKMQAINTFKSVAVSTLFGLNQYLTLKTNIHGIFASDKECEYNDRVNLDSNNYIEIFNDMPTNGFNGFGFDALLQINYPYRKLLPYVSLGCGYTYFRNSFYPHSMEGSPVSIRRTQISPSAYDITQGRFDFDKNVNLFVLTSEAGIIYMLHESFGITLSFVCTYPVKQSFFHNLSYKTDSYENDDTLLPVNYEEITTSSLKKTDTLDLTPMYIIQVGFIFRLD